jgi:hypothetical protein
MSGVESECAEERYLVIGGAGFLGSHIVEALLARKEPHVAVYDLNNPPEGDALEGTTYFLGDILDESNLLDVLNKVRTLSTRVDPTATLITLPIRLNLLSTPSQPYSTSSLLFTGSGANCTTGSTSKELNPSSPHAARPAPLRPLSSPRVQGVSGRGRQYLGQQKRS